MKLTDSIRYIPGIGEKRAAAFARLGIETVGELLYHFPRAYEHRGDIRLLSEVEDGEVCSVLLTIAKPAANVKVRGRMELTKVTAFDETRRCSITFFNQGYLKEVLRLGATFRFYGKVSVKGGVCSMSAPTVEPYYPGVKLPEFHPVYPLASPLTQKNIRDAVCFVLDKYDLGALDPLPPYIREGLGLEDMVTALNHIHRPNTYAELDEGRRRFVFEELFLFSMAVTFTRRGSVYELPPGMSTPDLKPFYSALPFEFTDAQARCAREILSDMIGDKPMVRLLSGDVGSGKTAVAAFAAYVCVKNGYQCAIMAPTEILANQHYADLSELFGALGIRCALLTGSVSAANKKKVKTLLSAGEIDIVIGTHALLSEGVDFAALGLVVTDEQHRFGVMQRAHLTGKGQGVHLLVMSATPIPRTMSLILYGDLALSEIDTLPPGRQKVGTYVVDESYRPRLDAFIRKNVAEGGQVYIVCPAVEAEEEGLVDLSYDGEKPKIKNVTDYTRELQSRLPELSIATMYGRMKGAEKEAVMSAFARGEVQVLVSTTVIEVGVNVPNASLMIVENAERFGLAQLHQLRGRVGRGKRQSHCVLVSDSKSAEAKERLEALRTKSNGYEIAEIDLKMRGPGDFFPSGDGRAKQSGAYEFRLASMCNDMPTLERAAELARRIAETDPDLASPLHTGLKAKLLDVFTEIKGTIS
ncbi:MAG: ATP-dependent DNA helicase RecG [Clostridia bacterium]|nr:ATP-dependent DNA helicase RecG [Clostridia bacterium]